MTHSLAQYCTKCGKKLVPRVKKATIWNSYMLYDPDTGDRKTYTLWICPVIADAWFEWGHSWFEVTASGERVRRYGE